jgi:ABC-type anion transport system duplicated permease subunit
MEAFLQASGCSEYTKNAWLFLKRAINKLSTTFSTSTTSAQDEIRKIMSATKMKLSVQTALLPKLSTYADHACLARSQSVHEKHLSGRALKEMMVKVLRELKLFQTRERLVE